MIIIASVWSSALMNRADLKPGCVRNTSKPSPWTSAMIAGRFAVDVDTELITTKAIGALLLLLRLERFLDLLVDRLVVLAEELFLVLGQDAERHAEQRLIELDVEEVLPGLDAAGDLEEQSSEAAVPAAQLDFAPRHRGT